MTARVREFCYRKSVGTLDCSICRILALCSCYSATNWTSIWTFTCDLGDCENCAVCFTNL